MTQEQLASELNTTSNTIAQWERGERSIPSYLPLALETVERNKTAPKAKDTLKASKKSKK